MNNGALPQDLPAVKFLVRIIYICLRCCRRYSRVVAILLINSLITQRYLGCLISLPTLSHSQDGLGLKTLTTETYEDPTQQYAAICKAFEKHVSQVRSQHGLQGLHPSQCGRGQTLERTFCKLQIVS